MQRHILFLFLNLISLRLSGATQDSAAIVYAKKIEPDGLVPYMEVLASDSLEGRETGQVGQKRAAAYIEKHFRSLSLKPLLHGGYLQHTALSARANTGLNFRLNERNFVFLRDYFYPEDLADTMMLFGQAAFAGYGIGGTNYNDYKNLDVKNKVVVFFDGTPGNVMAGPGAMERMDLANKMKSAQANGAGAVLIITDSLQQVASQFLYNGRGSGFSGLPHAYITREVAKAMMSEADYHQLEKSEKKINRKGKTGSFLFETTAELPFTKYTERMIGQNVMGLLEGTDKKDEVIVLTAHYDHLGIRDSLIYPGADDDASGTTGVMEMARVFSDAAASGHRPRRSILFMAVSGEEKGLLGSSFYVKHPPVPLEKTIVNLNTDMIGRIDYKYDSLGVRDYVYIIGSDKLSTTLHAVNEKANASYTKLELDYTYNRPDDPNRYYYRSDHYNFAKHNIPVIFYFNGSHADYHRPSDTIEKIQFDLLAKRIQLIFLTAWEVANREDRITVDVKSDMPNKKED